VSAREFPEYGRQAPSSVVICPPTL
jgi:hypothetical protein